MTYTNITNATKGNTKLSICVVTASINATTIVANTALNRYSEFTIKNPTKKKQLAL